MHSSGRKTHHVLSLCLCIFSLHYLTGKAESGENKTPDVNGNDPVRLNILVWEGYAPRQWTDKFKEQFAKASKIQVVPEVSHAEDYDEFFDSIRAGKADIISIPSNMVRSKKFGFIEKGLVIPVRLENIKNYNDILPPLQRGDYAREAGKTYGIPIAHGPYGLAYNTRKLKDPPKSWKDLWKKDFEKQYVISSDQFEANIYITALASGIPRQNMNQFEKIYSQEFAGKLKDLASNARNQWTAVDTAEDLKGASLATSWGDSFKSLKNLGEEWKFAEPEEGTTGWLDYLLITKNALTTEAKRLAAEKWLDFVISPEFQAMHIVRELGNDPTSLASRSLLTKEEVSRHHLDDMDYFHQKRILWPVLEIRDLNGFESMWLQAQGGKNSPSPSP